ncbi:MULTISPECIES: hypothetical protein [Mangrovimonas]|uniref:hypothetical protein n=1 Tax=Mangrovimonas TaxID=1211036 RepID=UPI0006B5F153|nr:MULTISPECIES: hypothetical protein [Mangrovimonas]OMP32804.1 hypothetical protein BKM32_00385 [Mangrovimonas sp. DI 80]
MNLFESLNEASSKAVDSGEVFLIKSKEYAKLKVFEQLTISMSLLGKALLIGSFILIGFFFFAIAAAIALGRVLDDYALSTTIVGGFFLLLALLVYLLRHLINKKVIQTMSHKFFN